MRSFNSIFLSLLAASAQSPQPAFAAWWQANDQHVLLPPSLVGGPSDAGSAETTPQQHEFTLRHIYHKGSHKYPDLLRKVDIHPDTVLIQEDVEGNTGSSLGPFKVSSHPMKIQRMIDRSQEGIENVLEASSLNGQAISLPASAWSTDELPGPNISDKDSLISFAHMAANAYVTKPGDGEWEKIKGRFNYTEDFGWEEDGLRGHIFADTSNKTIVIGLKGTSFAVFDGADTTGNDKTNDNLFASCCCAQGGPYFWKRVCDCQTSTYTCNNTCLTKSLREKSHYYHAARDLYHNVTERYPDADIWLTGHSLGGVVTSLLGLTYGLPTVTFEAYPDALAAGRLGLPTPPGYHVGSHQSRADIGIYHVGHTADPVFMGTCNGGTASCSLGGYAMESQCHTGMTITYDTVRDLGWRSGIGNHRISNVIDNVIRKYDKVPSGQEDVDCVDCFNWKFYESNSSSSTTSSSSSSTKTQSRTATCMTPGWWGCLDETTTSPITRTSTTTITTCLTPGWFGCKDGSTTLTSTLTITTETHIPVPTITTTSSTSKSSATPKPSASSTPSQTVSATASSTSCTSADWFGFVCVDPGPDVSGARSATTKTKEAPKTSQKAKLGVRD